MFSFEDIFGGNDNNFNDILLPVTY
ncbi:hypothetical protein [Geminocystis herdmanii]